MRELAASEYTQIPGGHLEFSYTFVIGAALTLAVMSVLAWNKPKKGQYSPTFIGSSTMLDEENNVFDSYGHYKPTNSR